MPEEFQTFPCLYLGVEVEMTAERERHIAEHHPDLLPSHRDRIAETLVDPDEVRQSSQMSTGLLFSKRYDERFLLREPLLDIAELVGVRS